MAEHPALKDALRLVLRPGGAYAGTDPEFHRVRLAWQLARLPWVAAWGQADERMVGFCSWMDVTDARACADLSLEGLVARQEPLPVSTGPDLYLIDVAVDARAGARAALEMLGRLRWRRPGPRRIAWHRQRADGRRSFSCLSLRGE